MGTSSVSRTSGVAAALSVSLGAYDSVETIGLLSSGVAGAEIGAWAGPLGGASGAVVAVGGYLIVTTAINADCK